MLAVSALSPGVVPGCPCCWAPGTTEACCRPLTLPTHVQVVDALVVSLANWTVLLNPDALKPSVAFGENAKARLSTEAIFMLANRCACWTCPSACAGCWCHAAMPAERCCSVVRKLPLLMLDQQRQPQILAAS